MDRIDKINYYLDIAETVLERGTCLRRNFGAIIVNNDQIVSSVSAGVYQAVAAALSQAKGQGSGSTPIFNIYVGGKQVTDVVVEEVNKQTRSTGICPILT